VCAVLALVSNVLLIPPFGVVGAAIATAVTLSLQMLIAAAMVRQKLGVVTLPLWPGQAAPLGPQGEPGGAEPS
jgi:O-antigen/teichoic acid export membrane protein